MIVRLIHWQANGRGERQRMRRAMDKLGNVTWKHYQSIQFRSGKIFGQFRIDKQIE